MAVVVNVYGKADMAQIEKAEKQLAGMKREVSAQDKPWSKFGSVVSSTGAKIASGLAAAGIARWLAGTVSAAKEAEVAQADLMKAVAASGGSWKRQGPVIDALIQKHSMLASVDDEELSGAFSTLTKITGKTGTGMKNLGLVTDLARGAHISLNAAAKLVGKVAMGNTSALSRYGIVLKEGGTVQENLAAIQGRYAGQAKAYGETSAGAQDKFKIALENVQETIGSAVLPTLTSLSGKLVTVLNAFQNLPGPVKNVIMGVAAVAGAAVLLAPFVTAIIGVGKAMHLAALASKIWAAGQWLLNAAMSANPIGLIVIAVAALVGVFVLLWTKCEWFRDFWIGLWDKVKGVAEAVWPVIQAVGEKIVGALQWAWDTVSAAVTTFWDWAGGFIGKAVETWWSQISTVAGWIVGGLQVLWDTVSTAVKKFWDWAGPFITTAIAAWWEGIKINMHLIRRVFETVWDAIVLVVQTAVGVVKKTVDLIGDVIEVVRGIWDKVSTATSDAWDKVVGVVRDSWNAIKSKAENIKDDVVGAVQAVWKAITSKATDAWDGIVGIVKDAWNDIAGFVNKIISAVNWVVDKVPGMGSVGNVPSFPVSTPKTMDNGGGGGPRISIPKIMDNGGMGAEEAGKGGGITGALGSAWGWVNDLWDKFDIGSHLPRAGGGLLGGAQSAILAMAQDALLGLLKKFGIGGDRQSIVDFAKGRLGDPYVWGGTAPGGFDCSGLIYWAYQQAGKDWFPRIPGRSPLGTQISQGQIQPADVMFYYPGSIQNGVRVPFGHFKMYAGNGQTIESTSGGVQMRPADWSGVAQIRSYLAMGGITRGLAIAGEAGPEAVIPLTNARRGAAVLREAGLIPGGVYIAPGAVVVTVTGAGSDSAEMKRVIKSAVDDGLERLAREIAAA